jgi:hypothetical protein
MGGPRHSVGLAADAVESTGARWPAREENRVVEPR